MLDRSPAPIWKIVPGCRPRIKLTNWQRDRAAWNTRKRRSRKRKRELKNSHSILTTKLDPNLLIDVAVRRGLLIERDVSDDPVKLQAVLNILQAEFEGEVKNLFEGWQQK